MNDSIFEQERARLLSSLGAMAEGGSIDRIEPIGSSSVPGLEGSGHLDIGLSVWPFPINGELLNRLGYYPTDDPAAGEQAGIQRFADSSGQVQLWLINDDQPFFENALLIRDYLRSDEKARQMYVDNYANKAAFFSTLLSEAQHWWVEQYGFAPLKSITAEFAGANFPWYISSGWALDLFLGRVTRVHRDVDVVVPFKDQLAMQEHLLKRGWKLVTPLDGRLEPWPRHMQLRLPRHQVHAHRPSHGDLFNGFIDLLLTEIEHGVWRYRRNPAILRNIERMALKSPGGIPYLAPELVLLFKSKNTSKVERPQDRVDFEQTLSLLEPERRAWLRWALTASDPDNPWLERI